MPGGLQVEGGVGEARGGTVGLVNGRGDIDQPGERRVESGTELLGLTTRGGGLRDRGAEEPAQRGEAGAAVHDNLAAE